jgi:hypothetical protein
LRSFADWAAKASCRKIEGRSASSASEMAAISFLYVFVAF